MDDYLRQVCEKVTWLFLIASLISVEEFVPYDLPNSPAWLWPTIMLVLCVMGIVATVLFMVFFTVKRKSDMVVDTKFSFVVITLMGICMSYASILLESLAINSTICAMRPLFWSFGPVIMIG